MRATDCGSVGGRVGSGGGQRENIKTDGDGTSAMSTLMSNDNQ